MRYEILDGESVTNVISADADFMFAHYPAGNYREVAEAAHVDSKHITPEMLIRRIGFPRLANIQIFIDGGIPAGQQQAGTIEERATVKAAWEYGRSLSQIDLSSQDAADMLGILALHGLLSWEDGSTLLAGGGLV